MRTGIAVAWAFSAVMLVAQTKALQAQESEIGIQTRRLEASVGLIGAIGGGWSVADMPNMAARPPDAGKRPT